jgi:hypothetical protein
MSIRLSVCKNYNIGHKFWKYSNRIFIYHCIYLFIYLLIHLFIHSSIICLFLDSSLILVVSYEDISPEQTHIWCLFCMNLLPSMDHMIKTCRYEAGFFKFFSHRWTININCLVFILDNLDQLSAGRMRAAIIRSILRPRAGRFWTNKVGKQTTENLYKNIKKKNVVFFLMIFSFNCVMIAKVL